MTTRHANNSLKVEAYNPHPCSLLPEPPAWMNTAPCNTNPTFTQQPEAVQVKFCEGCPISTKLACVRMGLAQDMYSPADTTGHGGLGSRDLYRLRQVLANGDWRGASAGTRERGDKAAATDARLAPYVEALAASGEPVLLGAPVSLMVEAMAAVA